MTDLNLRTGMRYDILLVCLQAHVPPRVTVERFADRSSNQPINHKVGILIYLPKYISKKIPFLTCLATLRTFENDLC